MFNISAKKALSELNLNEIARKYHKQFSIVYKLRSEYVDRLHKKLLKILIKDVRLFRKKPNKYSLVPSKDTSVEVQTLIDLRNSIVLNVDSLKNKIRFNEVIETFDYHLEMIIPIDKKIEKNKQLLQPLKLTFKTIEDTEYGPDLLTHTLELRLDESKNRASSSIFAALTTSRAFIKAVDNYIELQDHVLQDLLIKTVTGSKGKISKKDQVSLKSKGLFGKLRSKFQLAVKNLVGNIVPKTINLIGFDSEDDFAIFSVIELMNSKLKLAVISNMGPGSLVNRTGRFANSARITEASLEKENTLGITYTYRRNPYSVFEPEVGTSPWNTPRRDPKRIIEKSLRQLANEATLSKFGLTPTFSRKF